MIFSVSKFPSKRPSEDTAACHEIGWQKSLRCRLDKRLNIL